MSTLRKLAARGAMRTTGGQEIMVPLDKIRFDPSQPRKAFHHLDGRVAQADEDYIEELARSIEAEGQIQAITVREVEGGIYEVVVGECRTRAHMKLGLPTVRAVVRNDLTNAAAKLLFQLAENVNRQDLTDNELAESISQLMKGNEATGMAPMTQTQIAGKLGKSEGWVSKFVKFGTEEVQRLWVKSGIADTVEKTYRLSVLPVAVQVEIQRRCDLAEGDPERLEKPLNRNVIDNFANEVKLAKSIARRPEIGTSPLYGVGAPVENKEVAERDTGVLGGGAGFVIGNDPVDLMVQQAVMNKAGPDGDQKTINPVAQTLDVGKYTLSPEERNKLLDIAIQQVGIEAESVARTEIRSPVSCRVTVKNIEALLDILKSNKEMVNMFQSVRCEINIPGDLAGLIANELMGVIVSEKEISSVMQTELIKLL